MAAAYDTLIKDLQHNLLSFINVRLLIFYHLQARRVHNVCFNFRLLKHYQLLLRILQK